MDRIKICYTIPNFDTCGSGIALMKLIMGLDRSVFEPHIVCLHDRGKYFDEVVRVSGVPVHIYPYLARSFRPLYFLFRECWRISRFFRREGFDIVFSYHYGNDYSEAIAAKLAGKRFLYVKKNMSWTGSSHNGWLIKTFLADAITVQNSDMLKTFFRNMSKARLLSIGVDTDEYHPRAVDTALKGELGLKGDMRVILCVANIIPKKGINFLLEGFAALPERDRYRLIIVGDCNHELGHKMISLSQELGIGDLVLFTGKRFDVHRFYSIADLFILPSTGNEGAPIAIQEAMASGVVVITTDTPGNRDQLSCLPNQLIEPNSASAITNALHVFLNISTSERASIVAIQQNAVDDRFSLKAEISNHESLYKEIMHYGA